MKLLEVNEGCSASDASTNKSSSASKVDTRHGKDHTAATKGVKATNNSTTNTSYACSISCPICMKNPVNSAKHKNQATNLCSNLHCQTKGYSNPNYSNSTSGMTAISLNMTNKMTKSQTNNFIESNRLERSDSQLGEEADCYLDVSEPTHPGHVLSGINSLRRQGLFCDILLVVEDHEFPAHRAVLASCSPYLFDFLNAFEEGTDIQQLQPSYKLKEISHVGFEYLLEFMYTGSLRVPLVDMPVVYATAIALKMESAVRNCAGFLAKHLTNVNCLGIRRMLKDREMKGTVDEYIRTNLSEVMGSKSFFGLTDMQIEVVGVDEDIANEAMERRLFSLVLDWAKNNLNDLKPKMDRLTEKVNVLFLNSDNTLRDCADLEDSHSSDDEMIQDYKVMARKTTKRPTYSQVLTANTADGAQPFHKFSLNPEEALSVAEREWSIVATRRSNENVYFAIALLDGHLMTISVHLHSNTGPTSDTTSSSGSGPSSPTTNGASQPAIHPVIIRKASINPLEGMRMPRCAMGAVALGDQLVVCGGYDRGECLSSVEAFSIFDNKWTCMPDMNGARGRFSASELSGYIYVCGGSNGYRELNCVERYNPATQKWKFMASMLKERSSHGMTKLDGRLYVVGGCDGQRSIAECEVYDPNTNRWAKIAPLNAARSQTTVCSMHGLVFAIGGTDLWNTLNTVEVYSPHNNTWTLHSQLNIGRRGAGVDIVGDLMMVVGGSDGAQSLVSTEIYNPATETWTLGPALTVPRANLSCVSVSDRLCAVGGFSGKKFLNTLEWLDMEGGEWFKHTPRCYDNSSSSSDASQQTKGDNASLQAPISEEGFSFKVQVKEEQQVPPS